MASVLVLDTGTQGLAMVRALHKAGHRVVLLYNGGHNYAGDSRYVDKKYVVLGGSNSSGYLERVMDVLEREQIDLIIPMSDATAAFVSRNKAELQRFTRVECPDYVDFMRGYDKNQLMALCHAKGYPHPTTLDLHGVDIEHSDVVRRFPFPAMLKPNQTTGGRGMVKVESYDEIRRIFPDLHRQHGAYHLPRYVRKGGRQVKCQLYIDEDQRLLAHSVMQKMRWYPNEAGSNCCAVSIEDMSMVGICHRLLKDLNWVGFADFDTIEDPDTGELLIMELNPRVPACIKLAIVSGVNWGQVMVNACLHQAQEPIDYATGTMLRHFGLDFLWFLHDENRWQTRPNWFKFLGKNIYYQDMSNWTDPWPFVTGTWNNLKKILTGHGKGAV